MEGLLSVKSLNKSFKGRQVLGGVSFTVFPKEILCILGPNGAGKTTIINIITAALSGDGGAILFKGRPIGRQLRMYKQSLGIVPQNISLYEELSAERNLSFFASLYGLQGKELKIAVGEALAFAGLEDRRKDKVKTYSSGMKRRLNVACAIAHRPELVIMDEPTVGIDPQSRNHILESIIKLREEGTTIVYTTHYMEEVETISTRIIILDRGSIIAEGAKEELKASVESEKHYIIETEGGGALTGAEFYKVEGVKAVKNTGGVLEITSLKGVENLDRIIALLSDYGVGIHNITSEKASLERVFLNLTGRKLRD